jgi:type IV pilus assembly protein PilB
MLVDGGLITQQQLEEAIEAHKRTPLKLGQYLVREGIVNGGQVVDLLSEQLRIEKYTPG